MTYTWGTFVLNDALAGVPVGFEVTGHTYDMSQTGILEGVGPMYYVTIQGYTLKIDNTGLVKNSTPTSTYIGQTLKMVTTELGSDGAVGGDVTRQSGASDEHHDATAVLTTMEPRDHFAVNVLGSMLVHMKNPESLSDSARMMYSRAAYRWAQAMMIAAADSREGQSTDSSTNITVNTNDLQSNTERLLYNISNSLEQGVIIKGSNALGAEPVHTKITSMPNVTVADLDKIAEAYTIPTISGAISIKTGIFQQKFIRFEFVSYMAYSNISIFLELNVKEGETATTRKVGYTLQKGSVVAQMALDAAVTEITSITTKTIRGKGENDPNTYTLIADS